jgi:molecular chaperone GrpE
MTDENYQPPTPLEEEPGPEQAAEAAEEGDDLAMALQECQAKAAEYLDGWQRARADFANYKRRIERDSAQSYQNAVGSVVRRHLDVLDDLELALKNRPQEGEGAQWAQGIELIARKLSNLLESEGVKKIDAGGQQFDPNLHEALTHEENEAFESGQIIDVVKHGYTLGDRVLRPALVRVAK